MRVLLDTSYVYDLMEAFRRFRDAERRFFEEHAAHLYVSAVSIWEMRLKYHARHGSGDRKSRFDPEDAVAALQSQDVAPLTAPRASHARGAHPPAQTSPEPLPFDTPIMH